MPRARPETMANPASLSPRAKIRYYGANATKGFRLLNDHGNDPLPKAICEAILTQPPRVA